MSTGCCPNQILITNPSLNEIDELLISVVSLLVDIHKSAQIMLD
jgi:hypothetical protein